MRTRKNASQALDRPARRSLRALVRVGAIACAGVLCCPATAMAAEAGSSPAPAGAVPDWVRAYSRAQWSAAVELLEEIPERARTAWDWLHLARALEKRGQLVESFASYERLAEVATEEGPSPGTAELARQGKAEAAGLAARIPWAEVALGELPPGALVFVDQQWLEPARLRSPYPVNPGWHTFLVESNGVVVAARRAYFEEGQSRLVPLSGAGRALEGGARSGEAGSPRAALAWRSAPRADAAERQGNLLPYSYASLAVGALGTAIGTGFAIAAAKTRGRLASEPPCFSPVCTSQFRSDARRASETWRTRSSAAIIGYSVGVLGLVTGGALWLVHRGRAARTSVEVAGLELEPGIHPRGVSLSGRF